MSVAPPLLNSLAVQLKNMTDQRITIMIVGADAASSQIIGDAIARHQLAHTILAPAEQAVRRYEAERPAAVRTRCRRRGIAAPARVARHRP